MIKSRGVFYFSVVVQALVAAYVNFLGPFHRDGSFFLFISQQILRGKSPYYSVTESKNPFVEYFWAGFNLLMPNMSMELSSRLAESLWLGLTVVVIYWALAFLFPRLEDSVSAKILLLLGQFAASYWVFTDNGFNISLYQAFFEFVAIWIVFFLLFTQHIQSTKKLVKWSVFLGLTVFLSWMVKQTSLVSIFLPLLFMMLTYIFKNGFLRSWSRLKYVAVLGPVVSVLLLFLYFIFLKSGGVFENYWDSTFTYNAALAQGGLGSGAALSLIYDGLARVILNWSLLVAYIFWGFVILSVLILFLLPQIVRSEKLEKVFLGALWFWCAGVVFQCVGKFTFFSHYFLALIFPIVVLAILTIGYLPRIDLSEKWKSINILAILVLTCSSCWVQGDVLREMKAKYSQNSRAQQLQSLIEPSDAVFNWSGLMHYFVLANADSHFELNQSFYYLIDYHWVDVSLDEYMQRKFRGDAPDFFLEQKEDLPPGFRLKSLHLSAHLLKTWTNCDYKNVYSLPKGDQRYEFELNLFKKDDANCRN